MARKYLRKNEFRFDVNPAVRNSKGQGHMAYVTARYGRNYKINIITHSRSFFNEPTVRMKKNPNISKPSDRPSYFSVPRWENDYYLKRKPRDVWRISKEDRTSIRKFNVKYAKQKKQ